MDSLTIMKNTINGLKAERIPVAPHWFGIYKYEVAGLARNYDELYGLNVIDNIKLAEIEENIFKVFKSDWIHLGCSNIMNMPTRYSNKAFIRERGRALEELRKLESKQAIDEYIDINSLTEDEKRQTCTYDHVRIIADKYGSSTYIAVNEGNPICDVFDPHGIIGFEEGLIALIQKPDMIEYLLYRLYEKRIEWMKLLATFGCHAYIGSETYASADLISPDTYRNVIFPSQQYFYSELKKLGLDSISYFLGDINPLIDDISKLDIHALIVEESKKSFNIDVVEIRKKLSPEITLFGNVDSVEILLRGSVDDVKNEVNRQLKAAEWGKFILSNGSPLAFGTPRENILKMIETCTIL